MNKSYRDQTPKGWVSFKCQYRVSFKCQLTLLDTVAQHKLIFFKAAWARYDTAELGTLRLSPHSDLEKVLRTDYAKMAEMFFDNPPSFDNILKCIGALEAEVNAIGQSF